MTFQHPSPRFLKRTMSASQSGTSQDQWQFDTEALYRTPSAAPWSRQMELTHRYRVCLRIATLAHNLADYLHYDEHLVVARACCYVQRFYMIQGISILSEYVSLLGFLPMFPNPFPDQIMTHSTTGTFDSEPPPLVCLLLRRRPDDTSLEESLPNRFDCRRSVTALHKS